MTQKEVDARMGVSQKRISDLEKGSVDVLQVDTLRRYIATLDGKLEVNAVLPDRTICIVWDLVSSCPHISFPSHQNT